MTEQRTDAVLADYTTLRVGGKANTFLEVNEEPDFIDAMNSADEAGKDLLVLGGGSNLVIADSGFDGVVVTDTRRDITRESTDGMELVTVSAGTPWDDVVSTTVQWGLSGLEALSGIPGSTGATPVQNVGAYGQEISQTLSSVRVWNRQQSRIDFLTNDDLGFAYRTSLLRRTLINASPQYIVLDATFSLKQDTLSRPIAYSELAKTLRVDLGDSVPLADVRDAVLELRTAKGMVLDEEDHDTWSAGSFFTNPILDEATAQSLPEDAPRFPVLGVGGQEVPGLIKTSAAWLIDHAGISKGFGLPGPAAVSTKHVLALTNRGGAKTSDILDLARTVREAVRAQFDIDLMPEPILVGCEL